MSQNLKASCFAFLLRSKMLDTFQFFLLFLFCLLRNVYRFHYPHYWLCYAVLGVVFSNSLGIIHISFLPAV